jgi:hypothetical protein
MRTASAKADDRGPEVREQFFGVRAEKALAAEIAVVCHV